jgi:hypothetical protein
MIPEDENEETEKSSAEMFNDDINGEIGEEDADTKDDAGEPTE